MNRIPFSFAVPCCPSRSAEQVRPWAVAYGSVTTVQRVGYWFASARIPDSTSVTFKYAIGGSLGLLRAVPRRFAPRPRAEAPRPDPAAIETVAFADLLL